MVKNAERLPERLDDEERPRLVERSREKGESDRESAAPFCRAKKDLYREGGALMFGGTGGARDAASDQDRELATSPPPSGVFPC